MPDDQIPPADDKLHGWKEIAAHVGKTPRSLQRYEKEYALPVHRLNLKKGQTVWAYRHELDEWLLSLDQAKAASVALDEDPPGATEDDRTLDEPDTRGTREIAAGRAGPSAHLNARLVAAAIVAALVLGTIVGTVVVAPMLMATSAPTHFAFVGTRLEAREPSGAVRWTYDFRRSVTVVERDSNLRKDNAGAIAADLDGDGDTEVVVPVRFSTSQTSTVSDSVAAFSHDGDRLWIVEPPGDLECQNGTFRPPWRVSDLEISEGPGPRRVWVAFNHHVGWPGLVVEVAADGQQRLMYAQTGWVRSLETWRTLTGDYLVAGGVSSEVNLPMLAVLDPSAPPASNPTNSTEYSCATFPRSAPRAVISFSNDEFTTAMVQPYATVDDVRKLRDSIRVDLSMADGGNRIVMLPPSLKISDITFSDRFWDAHRVLEREGKFAHSVEDCPELRTQRIRIWSAQGGWTEQHVTPTVRTAERR